MTTFDAAAASAMPLMESRTAFGGVSSVIVVMRASPSDT